MRAGYPAPVKREPEKFVVVDGTLKEEELEVAILQYVELFLSKKSGLGDV
jgi:hypothetical protein